MTTKVFELGGNTFATVSRTKINVDGWYGSGPTVDVALGDFSGEKLPVVGSQTLDADDCRELSDFFAKLAEKLDKKA